MKKQHILFTAILTFGICATILPTTARERNQSAPCRRTQVYHSETRSPFQQKVQNKNNAQKQVNMPVETAQTEVVNETSNGYTTNNDNISNNQVVTQDTTSDATYDHECIYGNIPHAFEDCPYYHGNAQYGNTDYGYHHNRYHNPDCDGTQRHNHHSGGYGHHHGYNQQ